MYPTIAEYNQAIQKRGGGVFVTLSGLTFIPSRTVPVKIFSYGAGTYAVVFKAADNLKTYAIRCFLTAEQEKIDRYRQITAYLKNIQAAWKVDFDLLDREIMINGNYYPVLKMDWAGGKPLNAYVDGILSDNRLLTALQQAIVALSRSLEANHTGHGDIQCGNMLIQTDAANKPVIRLIDYDGMYIPAFKNKQNLEKGRTEFQHPMRARAAFNEKIDRFSFWVILCALEALKYDKSLWQPVMQGGYNTLDNMLFTGNDFANFNSSKLVNRLYALNQPSLNFYVNKLNGFCNTSPFNTEAPAMFGSDEESGMGNSVPAAPDANEQNVVRNAPETPEPIIANEEFEITSTPTGAAVLTADFQRLGVTPIRINKQQYLRRTLMVAYGTEFKPVHIAEDSALAHVSFSAQTAPPPKQVWPPPGPPEPGNINVTIYPPPEPPKTGSWDTSKTVLLCACVLLLVVIIGIVSSNSNSSSASVIPDSSTDSTRVADSLAKLAASNSSSAGSATRDSAVADSARVADSLAKLADTTKKNSTASYNTNSNAADNQAATVDNTMSPTTKQLLRDAENGDANAQTNLGVCYYKGYGVMQDYAQAVYWYRKAADQGYAIPQTNLGGCYYKGNGVTQDYSQAVYWFRKAADQGDANAQYNLGVCYANGYGVTQDYAQAVYWFRKAADQGDVDAQTSLGLCYYNGYGVTQDYSQAVYWYRKAADQGVVEAQDMLGVCYANGYGVTQDYSQATYWWRKAADQGLANAQCLLGLCYYNGYGVTQDYSQAVYWLRKAADQGNVDAQTELRKLGESYP